MISSKFIKQKNIYIIHNILVIIYIRSISNYTMFIAAKISLG